VTNASNVHCFFKITVIYETKEILNKEDTMFGQTPTNVSAVQIKSTMRYLNTKQNIEFKCRQLPLQLHLDSQLKKSTLNKLATQQFVIQSKNRGIVGL